MSDSTSQKPPSGTMRISINGLRSGMTEDYNELSSFLHQIIKKTDDNYLSGLFDKDELISLADKVGQNIGIFNCVSSDKESDFDDMSERLTIDFLSDKHE